MVVAAIELWGSQDADMLSKGEMNNSCCEATPPGSELNIEPKSCRVIVRYRCTDARTRGQTHERRIQLRSGAWECVVEVWAVEQRRVDLRHRGWSSRVAERLIPGAIQRRSSARGTAGKSIPRGDHAL